MADRKVGGVSQPTVSARDVHTFVGVGRDFTNWAKYEIARCSLCEGVEYDRRVLAINGENTRTVLPAVDYVLTLAAAKKIGMSARGRRGDAVREYFIECERRLEAGEPPIPSSVPLIEPPAPPPNALPDGAYQPSMPERSIPLTMLDFLRRIA